MSCQYQIDYELYGIHVPLIDANTNLLIPLLCATVEDNPVIPNMVILLANRIALPFGTKVGKFSSSIATVVYSESTQS